MNQSEIKTRYEQLSNDLRDALRVLAHAEGSSDGCSDLQAILLLDLLRHLLCRVVGHGVGDFVSKHDGERRLFLRDGQQTLINDDFSARHTECVDAVVLHEVELPRVVRQFVGVAVVRQVGLHSVGGFLSDSLHHGGVRGVGRFLGACHVLRILRCAQREHFLIADHEVLLATREGHCARRSAGREQHGSDDCEKIMFQMFHVFLLFKLKFFGFLATKLRRNE